MTEDSLTQAHLVPQGLLPVEILFIVPHLFGQDNFPQIRCQSRPLEILCHFQHLQILEPSKKQGDQFLKFVGMQILKVWYR